MTRLASSPAKVSFTPSVAGALVSLDQRLVLRDHEIASERWDLQI